MPSICPRTWRSRSSLRAVNSENLMLEEPALSTAIASATMQSDQLMQGALRSTLEPVLPKPAIQLRARNPKLLSRSHFVPAGFAHDLRDGLSFENAEIGAAQLWNIRSRGQREVLSV